MKTLREEIMEKMVDRFNANALKVVSESYEKFEDSNIYKDLKKAFIESCNKCVKLQTEGKKDRITFAAIHFLKSSAYTDSYELYINMYSDEFYCDRKEADSTWYPKEIMDYYIEDLKYIKSNILPSCKRPTSVEMEKIKIDLYGDYLKVVEKVCQIFAFSLNDLEEFREVKKNPTYFIYFSPYMEIGKPLVIGKGE